MDLHQWLRWALPGALWVGAAFVGVYIERAISDSEWSFTLTTGNVALVAAAILPLGYVAATVKNQLLLLAPIRRLFAFDAFDLFEEFSSGLDLPSEKRARLSASIAQRREANARFSAVIQLLKDDTVRQAATGRGRSLLDTINALATSAVGLLLGALSGPLIILVDPKLSGSTWGSLLVSALPALVLSVLFLIGERGARDHTRQFFIAVFQSAEDDRAVRDALVSHYDSTHPSGVERL